jgi:hypothetical protein
MKFPSRHNIQNKLNLIIEQPKISLINEKEMTPAQEKKREEIVLSMKKDEADFKKRYGEDWKKVMYATATKMAMKESTDELDESKMKELHMLISQGKSAQEISKTMNIALSTIKMLMKGFKESVELDEAGELQGETTVFEFTTIQDSMDFAAALHKANIKHRKNGMKVKVVDASSEVMSLAKKYGGRPSFDEDAPAVNTSGISGLTPDTVGVNPKSMGKTGDIQRRQETVKEGLERSIRSIRGQKRKNLIDELEGHPVFKVSSDEFNSFSKKQKRRNPKWVGPFKKNQKLGVQ